MLTEGQLEHLLADADRIFSEAAEAILSAICGEAAAAIRQGRDAPWLFESSLSILRGLMARAAVTNRAVTRAATRGAREALARSVDADLAAVRRGLSGLPAGVRAFLGRSTDNVVRGVSQIVWRDNLAMASAARQSYYDVTARYVALNASGAMGTEEAVRRAVCELSDRGIRVVDYASGASCDADVAIRRHLRTQVNQAALRTTARLCDDCGVEYVEVDRTAAPRPSHARWEGRVYKWEGSEPGFPNFFEATGYRGERGPNTSLADRLGGVNCGHTFRPWYEGIDELPEPSELSEEEVEERYRLTQRQRRHEREIRRTKRRIAHLEEVGADPTVERLRLGRQQASLRRLVGESGGALGRNYGREHAHVGDARQPVALRSSQGIQRRKKADVPDASRVPVNEALYNSQRNYVQRHGGVVIRGGEEVERNLALFHATASYFKGEGIIFLRGDATTSEVLEEVYHFQQDQRGDYSDLDSEEMTIRREIDAGKYLLSVAEQYHVPESEQETTRSNLASYEKQLKELLDGRDAEN